MTRYLATFMRMVEHCRSVVMPSQSATWQEDLPMVPMTTEELRDRLRAAQEKPEFEVLCRLAATGSASAEIIVSQLRPTREALREATYLLSDSRAAQVNLAAIVGETRFKVLTGAGVFRTKCPKKLCFEKDSFGHMIRCYQLMPWFAQGAKVVPFLVRMAKHALVDSRQCVIPDPEEATAESWARDRGGADDG